MLSGSAVALPEANKIAFPIGTFNCNRIQLDRTGRVVLREVHGIGKARVDLDYKIKDNRLPSIKYLNVELVKTHL